jgi:hypothetical protein
MVLPPFDDEPILHSAFYLFNSNKPGTSGAAESPKLCWLGAAPRRLANQIPGVPP